MPEDGREVDALGATMALDDAGEGELGSAATLAVDSDPSTGRSGPVARQAGPTASGTFPGSSGVVELRPFGPYTQVEALDDQGSMGVVARGYNEAFDRWELLKFLRADHALEPSRVRQFHREGRVLAKLSHPNVVQVFAIYQMEGRPCLAMELLHGDPLSKLVREHHPQGLPVRLWYELFLDAARGLSAAHQVGLLHRDLKPDNLFVLRDREGGPAGLKLIDFGLATADQTRRQDDSRSSLVADLSGGTPVYMAPELWAGEVASPRSDVFALGLAFTFAAVGRLPFEASTIVEALSVMSAPEPFPDPRQARPDLPKRFAQVLRKATAKPVEDRFDTVEDLLAALVAAWDLSRPRSVPGSGPYRGLRPYTRQERDVFFGRDEEIAGVLERLRTRGGVVLVGPGGSGKTSLVRAGVLPALLDGALGNEIAYEPLVIAPGRRPLQAVAAAVASVTEASEDEVSSFLGASPERLGGALRASLGPGKGYVVVVDPLEALADAQTDPGEAQAAGVALASLVEPTRPELRLIAAVRADRMDPLFSQEALRGWLTHGFHPVRPLRGEALRRALVEPARTAGYDLEDAAVIDEIVAEADRLDTGLPLVSFAMKAWWDRRDDKRKVLPTAAWVALGGVAGALVRHAEHVVDALDRDLRAAVEATLVRLVRSDGSRRRVARKELLDPGAALARSQDALGVLIQARVVQESFGEIEIVHDALVRRWPRLRELLETAGEDRAFRERLTSAAAVWEAQNRADGALWTGDQAVHLERWLASTKATLTQAELAFAEAVQRRTVRRRLMLRSVILGLVLVVAGFVVVAKSNERSTAAKLQRAVAERDQAAKAFEKAEASRLRLLAETLVGSQPGRALSLAAESYEIESHPVVDVIAWRAHARGVPRPIPSPEGGASVLQFSPSGAWLVLGGASGRVVLLATTKESRHVLSLEGQEPGAVSSVAVAPKDDRVAVGTVDGWFGVTSFDAPAARAEKIADGAVRGVAWDATGVPVILVHTGTGAALWRAGTTRTALTTDPFLGAPLHALPFAAVRPDGTVRWVGEGAADPAKLRTGDAAMTAAHGHAPSRGLVIGDADGRVSYFAGPKAKPVVVARHEAPIRRVGLSPDGRSVLSLDASGHLRLATVSGRSLRALPGARDAFAWIEARAAVAVSNGEQAVELWSTRTGEVVAVLEGLGETVLGMDADPAGRWIVVATDDGVVRTFVLEEATWRVDRGPLVPPPLRCALSGDGSAVACAWSDRIEVERFDSTGKSTGLRRIPKPPNEGIVSLAVGPDAKVSWSTEAHTYREGETEPAVPSLLIGHHGRDGEPALVVPRADGFAVVRGKREVVSVPRAKVLAGSRDGRMWLASRGTEIVLVGEEGESRSYEIEGMLDSDRLSAGTFSDDGTSFAVASGMGRVGVARVDRDRVVPVGKVRGAVTCLAFARSGRVLVAATASGAVQVFDSQGSVQVVEHVLPGAVQACVRSPVEDRFTFVSRDGSLRARWLDLSPLATANLAWVRATAPELDAWTGMPTERAW